MSIVDKMKRAARVLTKVGLLRRPSVAYCVDNELLPSLFALTASSSVRKMFNLPASEHRTQLNQDLFALLMNQFRPGFFVEIGANDGFTLSNTVYLEENFGWTGILVEANEKYGDSLAKRKNSMVINKAIAAWKGRAEFVDAGLYGGLMEDMDNTYATYTRDAAHITVDCAPLAEVLDEAKAPEQIDFISIDVEGGELPIVEQMVGVGRRFRCGCIEHNRRPEDYTGMVKALEAADYRIVWEGQTAHDLFFIDNRMTRGR